MFLKICGQSPALYGCSSSRCTLPHRCTGTRSVTCHPAEVTIPPLPQPKPVLDLATPGDMQGRVHLRTAIKLCSPCPRLHIAVAITINTIVSGEIRTWVLSHRSPQLLRHRDLRGPMQGPRVSPDIFEYLWSKSCILVRLYEKVCSSLTQHRSQQQRSTLRPVAQYWGQR